MSETAPELSEPSDPQESTQMNATFLHFPGDAPGSHLYFLAESYNAHFSALFNGFVPAVLLVCLNLFSLFSVFPPPSSYSLLPPALSHSPGTSLLQYCISWRVSEHDLSHCPPCTLLTELQLAVTSLSWQSEGNINIS